MTTGPSPIAVQRALTSLLDVVEELALGLAHGQTPDTEWAETVQSNFDKHRYELAGGEVDWEKEVNT